MTAAAGLWSARLPPGDYRRFGWHLLSLVCTCVGGTFWFLMRPVPDWRVFVHAGALAVAAAVVLASGYELWRTSFRLLAGTSALFGCAWLLWLAALSLLLWGQRQGFSLSSDGESASVERTYGLGNQHGCAVTPYSVYLGFFLVQDGPQQECHG